MHEAVCLLKMGNLREAINKLAYEGVNFAGLGLEPAGFLTAVAKRIKEQETSANKSNP